MNNNKCTYQGIEENKNTIITNQCNTMKLAQTPFNKTKTTNKQYI